MLQGEEGTAIYISRTTFYPAPGRTPDQRAVVDEWAKSRAAKGSRTAVLHSVLSEAGPLTQVLTAADDLADFEKQRASMLADPAYRPFVQKLAGVTRMPASSALYEQIVPAPAMPSAGDFLVRLSYYPNSTVTSQFQNSMTTWAKASRLGFTTSLVRQVFAPHGTVLQYVFTLKHLSEWEGFPKKVAADPETVATAAAHASMSRQPPGWECWQVVWISLGEKPARGARKK